MSFGIVAGCPLTSVHIFKFLETSSNELICINTKSLCIKIRSRKSSTLGAFSNGVSTRECTLRTRALPSKYLWEWRNLQSGKPGMSLWLNTSYRIMSVYNRVLPTTSGTRDLAMGRAYPFLSYHQSKVPLALWHCLLITTPWYDSNMVWVYCPKGHGPEACSPMRLHCG